MTEDEAKQKWCPQVRFTQWNDQMLSNRGEFSGATNCLASGCMAWRWANERGLRSDGASVPIYGYCGLAGKP
jgi:hypothetical protein